MQTGGEVPRITGLNAFGQPFRGRRIHGVGKAERDAGYAYGREQTSMRGPLANRGGNQAQFAERKLAEAEEVGEMHRNRMAEQAAERGRAKANAAVGTAPKKREGMLVPGPSGGAVWKTGKELDRAERGKARAEARKRMATEGSKTFVGPPRPKKPATFEGMSKDQFHLERNWKNFQTPGRMSTPNTASAEELQRRVNYSRRRINRDIENGYSRETALLNAGMLPEDMDPRE